MDIVKAFDSLDYNFLILALEKYGFGKNFILRVKILLRDQQSCVINSGTATTFSSLERGAHQGDPIPAFLYILALEILFILIKSTPEIKLIFLNKKNFDYTFLYSDDDTAFFLKVLPL